MERAYSLLTIKAVDEERREIRGIATTPNPDRVGDIVEPLGVKFTNPLPLLWQHRHAEPVGHVEFDKPTDKGITFRATLAKVADPGRLKDRIDEAWQSVKANLVRGVSIGFRPIETAYLEATGGVRFLKSEVYELSLVTVPANADASISSIKSIDQAQRAATGNTVRLVGSLAPPGAAGTTERMGSQMKPLADQIAALDATRAAKATRMKAIMDGAADEGRTTTDDERTEFDELEAEVKALEGDLRRLEAADKANQAAARPVPAARSIAPAAVTLKPDIAKGTGFTRLVMALAASRFNRLEALDMVRSRKHWMATTPELELILSSSDAMTKAAMAPGTITDADWAAPLVAYQQLQNELVELLRPATILGRIPGIRRVPFLVKIPVVTQGTLVNWVGEVQPKPVSEMKFGQISLEVNKVAGIVVLSEELVRLSTPSAEETVRTDLVAQIGQFLDAEFIDPANAAVAGISPASILNGVAGIPSAGPTAADARTDLQALIGAFIGANLGLSDSVFITTETIALQLGMLQNPLGQAEFAGVSLSGGTLLTRPLVSSQTVPAGILALVKASEILLADDGGVSIDVSREATLQMDSAPVAANPATFSLWQNNAVGIRAERWITWKRRRDQAVAYITGADYAGAVVSP